MISDERSVTRDLLTESHTVAVIGASDRHDRPAFYVPDYMANQGFDVLPVNPRLEGQELWGEKVVATLADLDRPVDIVNVFRRSGDVPQHLDDILSLDPPPRAVWLQLGIRNEEVAERLRAHGITVIQDSCLLVEHRALARQ